MTDVKLYDLRSHPIAAKFYELGIALEELGGGVEQTALITMLSELRTKTQNYINGKVPDESERAFHNADVASQEAHGLNIEPVVYNVGERTMEQVFRPNGLTNVSDLQAVLDATERALETSPPITRMTLDDYQDLASKTAVYPGQGSFIGLLYTAGKLNGEAGEVIENTCKALRDDGALQRNFVGDVPVWYVNQLDPERRLKLFKELGDTLWYISQTAKELGYRLSEVAIGNVDKLADRAVRGVLHGSGDDR